MSKNFYSKVITWSIIVLSFILLANPLAVNAEEQHEQDIMCLAKNIYYEAGLEEFDGQVAVAQVTLNRVEHEEFPNSVCGVVYHKTKSNSTGKTVCQFSWVCNVPSKIKYSSQRWEESYGIARNVIIDGLRLHELQDAMYFHNTHVSPSWGRRLERLTKIGGHIFYSSRLITRR